MKRCRFLIKNFHKGKIRSSLVDTYEKSGQSQAKAKSVPENAKRMKPYEDLSKYGYVERCMRFMEVLKPHADATFYKDHIYPDFASQAPECQNKGVYITYMGGGAIADDWMQDKSAALPLVKDYKIHLMPKDEDFVHTAIKLINALKSSYILQRTISQIKIKPILEKEVDEAAEERYGMSRAELLELPKIVIYICGGTEDAQKALDEIFRIFKEQVGVNRGPKYNKKVTSLIFFAQGNREDKDVDSAWIAENGPYAVSRFFEQPDMIYFRPDVTGTTTNYHLILPK